MSLLSDVPGVGYLELIWGPMFCGKTTTLLHKLMLHKMCGKKVLYVNSSIDTRSLEGFSTHNPLLKKHIDLTQHKTTDLDGEMALLLEHEVIGLDESQFFGTGLVGPVRRLVEAGKIVYVGGLTGNSSMGLFGQMHELIPLANRVTTLTAICEGCSRRGILREASFTKRMIASQEEVAVGGHDAYIPVCRACHMDK